MKTVLQAAALAGILSAVAFLCYGAWVEHEIGKAVIASKGEMHATAAVVKEEVHKARLAADRQVQLLDVETSRRAVLTQAANANLNCPAPGARLGKGKESILCTETGVLPAAREAVQRLGTLARDTNTSLNDKDRGLLPELQKEIADIRRDQEKIIAQVMPTLEQSGFAVVDLRKAIQALTALESDKDIYAFIKSMNMSADELHTILSGITHPDSPGALVKSVRLLLQLLGIAAKFGSARQVAP